MVIGDIVKVDIPYKLGERRNGPKIKEGKIVGIYTNFVLVEFKEGYKECFREQELFK